MVMAVTADKSQRTMMFVLPLIFVPFIISFPAGLILYWITTNVWTIGQQFAIQKIIPVPVAATPEGAAAVRRNRRHRPRKRSGGAEGRRRGRYPSHSTCSGGSPRPSEDA